MSNPQNLTAKDIFIAEKRKDGMDYLMKRFSHQFKTEEELVEGILRIIPRGSDVVKKLRKNQKRADKKKAKKSSTATQLRVVELVKEEIPDKDELEEEMKEEEEIMHEQIVPTREQELQRLQEEEETIRRFLGYIEVQHKNCVTERRSISEKLRSAKATLKDFLETLKELQNNVMELYEAHEACGVRMEALNRDKNSYQELQREIAEAISNFKKVSIFVFESGIIEVENAEAIDLDVEEVNKELQKLFVKPEAEELTVKELKTIAKLRLMVAFYDKQGASFELAFEDEMLQQKYESFN